MNYYLGIDGGGTKTKVIIIDANEKVVFENEAGPSSVDTVSLIEAYENIKAALNPFIINHPQITFKALFAGLGGIVFAETKNKIIEKLKKLKGISNSTKITVENDMHNALYSGYLSDEGVVLIAGTGMVAFGRDLTGKEAKCGGWGYQEGELGSAYHLGKSAINYLIRAYDKRLPLDEFAKEVAFEVGLKKATDIIKISLELHTQRTKVASLAPIVNKYANLNHPYALKIIDCATSELALAVKGVIEQLTLKEKRLVVVGSLGNAPGIFKEKLHQKIILDYPNIKIISPLVDPAFAAALIAKR